MVSVIIPAYNAQLTIKSCIDALLNQTYLGDYEIIVVDDGSTDETTSILSQYKCIKIIRQQNKGPASARNNGVSAATGDIILFTDSDCEVFSDWIAQMVAPFIECAEIVGVKGIYKTRQTELIARFVQLEYEDKYDKMKKEKYIDFIDTYSAGFKKYVFAEAGGYDLSFTVPSAEDVDLSYRLAKKGYKMVFNPNAIVFHKHPSRLKDYLLKKFRFAFWRVRAVRKNPDKIFRDSHTPFVMKVQALLCPLVIMAIPLSIKNQYILPTILFFYFITTIPFLLKSLKKDIVVAILSPILLFLRGSSQFFGLASAVIKGT